MNNESRIISGLFFVWSVGLTGTLIFASTLDGLNRGLLGVGMIVIGAYQTNRLLNRAKEVRE